MTYTEKKCFAIELKKIREVFGHNTELFQLSLEDLMESHYSSAADSVEEWVELMVEGERYALIISPLSEDEIADRMLDLIDRLDRAGYWRGEQV